MRIDFFFDPGCPWCWITSRWITEVQPHRDLDVHWRTFSLFEKNRDTMPAEYLDRVRAGHGALRVAEAVRASDGESAVADFYTEYAARIHHDKVRANDIDIADVLQAVALPPGAAESANDDTWDTIIKQSMDEALVLAGNDVGVPLISFDGAVAYFGPVMTPAPQGDDALKLWDALATLTTIGGFYELKNSARPKPELHDRPQPHRTPTSGRAG